MTVKSSYPLGSDAVFRQKFADASEEYTASIFRIRE
jgi:hypothetical protein